MEMTWLVFDIDKQLTFKSICLAIESEKHDRTMDNASGIVYILASDLDNENCTLYKGA